MIPGEIICKPGALVLNQGQPERTLKVANAGDRAVQVGSHYHFYEVNQALSFDRELALGFRLDIPAGTAIRFEPGQEREVRLVALSGNRVVQGFAGRINGALEEK